MPYCGSFVYGNLSPDMCLEIEHGMKPLVDRESIKLSLPERQHATMLRNFSRFIHSPDSETLKSLQTECKRTMRLSGFVKALSQG
ncbi:hypothetical protein FE392_08300 [Xenorhabdus sp. 12]|uniref:Uncharacterized protein n=1 Tax=Xenorhabdus santafensis TaxID=2582833 RepID=A0ABU4S992_9GAMM|nr:hypothetical protein [Xenorhabdus sp. 12]MDX7987331.1 hypothetical protein [Xenorhabdus sp. 12]